MRVGEDLYVRMNSRGKPLTPFEHFKARFIQLRGALAAFDLDVKRSVLEKRAGGFKRVFSEARQVLVLKARRRARMIALSRIALHAARIAVAGIVVEAPIPDELARVWSALGGAADAWITSRT